MDFQEFVSKYTVHFGPLPADLKDPVQLREWGLLIAGLRAERLDEVIERVSVSMGASNKKPRIRDFRLAIRETDEPAVVFNGPGCGLCNETGWLTVLGSIDATKNYWDKSRHRLGHIGNNSRLYRVSVPCKCSKGRRLVSTEAFNQESLERCHAWLNAFMTECQMANADVNNRMESLIEQSIEMFGSWPTPGGPKTPPDGTSCVLGQGNATGGHSYDKLLAAQGPVLRAREAEAEAASPNW